MNIVITSYAINDLISGSWVLASSVLILTLAWSIVKVVQSKLHKGGK